MKKQVEWTLSSGAKATYTVELQLSKEVNLDGDKCTVPCCEIKTNMTVSGVDYVNPYVKMLTAPRIANGKEIVAAIGDKVGIDQTIYDQIKAAIAAVEATPEWVAKQQRIAKNEADEKALYAQRIKNGYCPKCGSYCHGDCSAN